MNILGSHDTARILTRMDGSKERVMFATALQLAYPGAPMIYYGDEAGVEGSYAEEGRTPYPWGREDAELLSFFKKAINARRKSDALSKGDVATVWIDDRGGYGIRRMHGNQRVVALFNNSDVPLEAAITLGGSVEDVELTDMLSTLPDARTVDGTLNATIPPLSAGWYRLP
jgi:pullulanase